MANETLLIVEDEKLARWALQERLRSEGFEIVEAATGAEGLAALSRETVDLILLDYRLPDMTGLDILRSAMTQTPDTPVILMTAHSSVGSAVEAMKLGAHDYVTKPFNHDEIIVIIRRALESSRLRREVRLLRSERQRLYGPSSLIGSTASMREVHGLIEKIARSKATTILITGESGTGKDLVAKAIHYASDRAALPFMNITCSALPEHLLENELMGHERGAFTDARSLKKGLFELAEGGTVFLDEIGDMGVLLQAKLLRFLEEKTFRRVGGTKDISVDVRIIAATNRDLLKAVREGRFREDLFYRLKVIPIVLPSLRERREDIPHLVKFFIDGFNREFKKNTRGVSDQALQRLMSYDWPGNVRELRNVLERAMILENRDLLGAADLPAEIRETAQAEPAAASAPAGPQRTDGGASLGEVERRMVVQALEKSAGNQSRAARLLGVSRDTLRYRMKKHGLL